MKDSDEVSQRTKQKYPLSCYFCLDHGMLFSEEDQKPFFYETTKDNHNPFNQKIYKLCVKIWSQKNV